MFLTREKFKSLLDDAAKTLEKIEMNPMGILENFPESDEIKKLVKLIVEEFLEKYDTKSDFIEKIIKDGSQRYIDSVIMILESKLTFNQKNDIIKL